MKIKVEFITARLNNHLLFVEAINDCYTEVQVILRKVDLDALSLDTLSGNLTVTEFSDSFNLGCCEAKDVTGQYGNIIVALESKIINFE